MAMKKQAAEVAGEIKETVEAAASEIAEAARTTRKRVARTAAEVYVEFSGSKTSIDAIVEKAKEDFKANNKGALKSFELYIKPEDGMAYYVINGVEGRVAL